jgi:hypothetical protein
MPRESGASSTLRFLDSIAGVSEYWIARSIHQAGRRRLKALRAALAPQRAVIASEAKQSMEQQQRKRGLLRRFAPRNDDKIRLRDLAARFARVLR